MILWLGMCIDVRCGVVNLVLGELLYFSIDILCGIDMLCFWK